MNPRTPKGFTIRPYPVPCSCPFEADQLLCWARRCIQTVPDYRPTIEGVRYAIAHMKRDFEKKAPNEGVRFWLWLTILSIDYYCEPGVMFRAIMEKWSRNRILQELRRRGATEL